MLSTNHIVEIEMNFGVNQNWTYCTGYITLTVDFRPLNTFFITVLKAPEIFASPFPDCFVAITLLTICCCLYLFFKLTTTFADLSEAVTKPKWFLVVSTLNMFIIFTTNCVAVLNWSDVRLFVMSKINTTSALPCAPGFLVGLAGALVVNARGFLVLLLPPFWLPWLLGFLVVFPGLRGVLVVFPGTWGFTGLFGAERHS